MFSLQRQTSERVSKSDAFNAKVSHPSRTVVYPKLEVTEPGDHDEQEADAVANDVMSGKICRQISHGSVGGGMSVSSQMEGRLNSLQGGGQAMPDGLRSMMERGFNRDFSQVRLHTDSEAASLSSSIHAKAFTHGNDIYFNQGQFSPNTSEGQKLMAHELTHVVQGGGKVGRTGNDSNNDIVDIIAENIKRNDFAEDDYDYIAEMIINNLNEPNFEKLLERLDDDENKNGLRFLGSLYANNNSGFNDLYAHFNVIIRKRYPNFKYAKTNCPSEKDYYNVLSADNLLILNMLTYLPHRNPRNSSDLYIRGKIQKGKSVMELINDIINDIGSPDDWEYEEGETISATDWKKIFSYIKKNELFKHIIIKDVQTDNYGDDSNCKYECDNQYKEKQFSILFYNEFSKEAIVAFRGTGLREWKDNFSGALNESTDGQKKALERYQKYIDSLDEYNHITVTGHSKGGNKAKYITVKDETVDRCVSFDGQGFSDIFINENSDSIKNKWGKIVNYNTDKDFVNILLNDIGNTYYLKSENYNNNEENEEDSFIKIEAHSPEVMLNFISHSAQLAEIGKIDDKMVALDKFLNSYLRTLSKCDFTDEKMKITDKDKKASVILLGELFEAIMNTHNRLDILSFLAERVRRHNEYRRCLAFLLAFIYSYMDKNKELSDMIPIPYRFIPMLSVKNIINKEDINNYINYFKSLEFDDGGDIVLSN